MTKGLGVNKDIFGETQGNLVKPGMTQDDLERLEKKTVDHSVPDPFAEVFNEKAGTGGAPAAPGPRAALPDQGAVFAGRSSALPLDQAPPCGNSGGYNVHRSY